MNKLGLVVSCCLVSVFAVACGAEVASSDPTSTQDVKSKKTSKSTGDADDEKQTAKPATSATAPEGTSTTPKPAATSTTAVEDALECSKKQTWNHCFACCDPTEAYGLHLDRFGDCKEDQACIDQEMAACDKDEACTSASKCMTAAMCSDK